jgi:hypothetical protein
MFSQSSRYFNSRSRILRSREGRLITYIERRFIPPIGDSLHQDIVIKRGDRLDLIAFRVLGDPELFWKVCDVNHQLHPLELTSFPGSKIHLPSIESQ